MTPHTQLMFIEEVAPHAQLHADTDYAALRCPPRESDPALSSTTRRWLRRLPPRQRPLRLCERYPRVANRIAWCWQDSVLTAQVMDDLLVDRRGGRVGFPAAVVMELRRLRDFHDRAHGASPDAGFCGIVGRPLAS